MTKSFTSRLKAMDFYRKIDKDISKGTLIGSIVSVVTAFFIVFLVGLELSS